jgi:Asp-tRNA(Asn)/Glu-tRNA(Gln) amidotransferase A subunit family amidase
LADLHGAELPGAEVHASSAVVYTPGEVPAGLLDAFWEYESALMANDLDALDRLFAPGPDTLRGDAGGLLVGHDAISAFRKGRGGAPQRTILRVEVRPVSPEAALIIAVFSPLTGGRGQQTQLWNLDAGRWVVSAAHVSAPAPAVASSIWRVVGTPLVAGASTGTPAAPTPAAQTPAALTLTGQTVAVKDLFAIEGFAVGGGVPRYLASQSPARSTSPAVQSLLAAGASVQGIAQTDEFAYSIAGKNPHYGTPPNPAVIGGIPGGSSSGPASAVATGQASIGLGTDTGGSIRVPASYQGLWGLRTTHGAVSVEGLLPLSPSFDTVGWLTRDAATLAAAASASLDTTAQREVAPRFVIDPVLVAQAAPEVQAAFAAVLLQVTALPSAAGLPSELEQVELGDPAELVEIFRVIQGAEAWRTHGDWIEAHPGALGADIAARFEWASTISAEAEAQARVARAAARVRIDAALDGRILLLPSAASAAPSTMATPEELEATRMGTLRLTCIAGILGAPALSLPLLEVTASSSAASLSAASLSAGRAIGGSPGGLSPVGMCLVGPRFTDLALIEIAAKLGING